MSVEGLGKTLKSGWESRGIFARNWREVLSASRSSKLCLGKMSDRRVDPSKPPHLLSARTTTYVLRRAPRFNHVGHAVARQNVKSEDPFPERSGTGFTWAAI